MTDRNGEKEDVLQESNAVLLRLLGEVTCAQRNRKGLTLAQLATCTNIPVEKIERMEAGNWDIDLATLYKMAACLDVTVSQMLIETEAVAPADRH